MAYYLPWGTRLASSGTDPFTWFPSLDKSLIPFTTDEPSAPTGTMTDRTATTEAELATWVYTPGSRITVTANIATANLNDGNISDVEIIINSGVVCGATGGFNVGGGGFTVTRTRVRGPTVGSYSGGQIHRLNIPASGSDVIVDGVALTGEEDFSCFGFGNATGIDKGAIVNCRMASGGFGVGSTCGNLWVCGNSILTGLVWPWTTNDEAYAFRAYFETNGNVILYANEMRSNPSRTADSHARARFHPDTGIGRIWIYGNRFVERVENHIIWVDAESGGGSGDSVATYVRQNEIISGSTGTGPGAATPKLQGADSIDAFIQNNVFKSEDFLSNSDISMSGTNSTTKADNDFQSLPVSDPAWGAALANGIVPGAGDPSGLDWTP